MKTTKVLLTMLCLWFGLMPSVAQSVTITKELEINPLASAIAMFKNQFGKWEKPDLNDTFPYAVIRMRLEGNETEVRKAKERLTLYMGQFTAVVDRYTENSNEILFLVPARRPSIYIDCGDGCEQVLLIENQQLRSNGVYYCTVHYQQSKEVIALEEEIALLKQRLEQLESGSTQKEEIQKEGSDNLQFNVNGVSFTMVKVNGGVLQSLPDIENDSVFLSDYYIGQTEVTQELWNAVMGYNNSKFSWGSQNPIETISWYESIKFIYRLNQLTGENFYIPSRAEWLYAASGETSTTNIFSGSNDLLSIAWVKMNAASYTHNVRTKTSNSLDIYDMTGNVAEWCYENNQYYALGGSWDSSVDECKIFTKHKPIKPNTASSTIGLRLVMHPKHAQRSGDVKIHYSADSTCVVRIGDVYFDMKFVEGGTFIMGQNSERTASPAHEVTLSNYYISETEVTEQLWCTIMGGKRTNLLFSIPKIKISYYDCLQFIIRLNALTGKRFRLPTEAEWEYAARGGKKTHRFIYSGSNRLTDVAWCIENGGTIHPVKSRLPNELGIHDMSGNVSEWCQDWYDNYNSSPQINPTGPKYGTDCVVRGGSCFNSQGYYPLVSGRSKLNPQHCSSDIGFRLVLAIDDEFAE